MTEKPLQGQDYVQARVAKYLQSYSPPGAFLISGSRDEHPKPMQEPHGARSVEPTRPTGQKGDSMSGWKKYEGRDSVPLDVPPMSDKPPIERYGPGETRLALRASIIRCNEQFRSLLSYSSFCAIVAFLLLYPSGPLDPGSALGAFLGTVIVLSIGAGPELRRLLLLKKDLKKALRAVNQIEPKQITEEK